MIYVAIYRASCPGREMASVKSWGQQGTWLFWIIASPFIGAEEPLKVLLKCRS